MGKPLFMGGFFLTIALIYRNLKTPIPYNVMHGQNDILILDGTCKRCF